MDGSTECHRITLFKPVNWLAKTTVIKHLSLANNLLMVVLAEYAGGKSSFTKLLSEELGESLGSLVFAANPSISTASFLDFLSPLFKEQPLMPKSLAEVFELVNQQQKHCLLIVDDAQNLPTAILEELLWEIKQQEPKGYFHICLVSDYTILPALYALSTQAFTDKIHTIELGALTEAESNTYVLNKSTTASRVSNLELAEFYQKTRGNMARMNTQLTAFWGGFHTFTENRTRYRSTLMSFLLFSIGLAFFLQDLRQPLTTAERLSDLHIAKADPLENQIPKIMTSMVPGFTEAAVRQLLEPSMRNYLLELEAPLEDDDNNLEGLVVLDKVVVLPKNLSARLERIEPQTKEKANPKETKVQQAQLQPQTQPRYTIQLLASTQEALLKKLAQKHPLSKDLKISEFNQKGVIWYVITLGEFTRRVDAELFMMKLSSDVLTFKPWIRPTSQLKAVG